MSGVNRPYRPLLCNRISEAVSGGVFLGLAMVEGTIVNLARGNLVEAVRCGMSIPATVVLGATAGAVGWGPSWGPGGFWGAACEIVKGVRR